MPLQAKPRIEKADSPIRWLLKPTWQAMKEHEEQIVYGEKISK